jgi:hypothetical protein
MSDQAPAASHSNDSYKEDWDNSLVYERGSSSERLSQSALCDTLISASQNSVAFPAATGDNATAPNRDLAEWNRTGSGHDKRTLSELLKLHAEKGTDCRLSQEEAMRLGDVLGQWVCTAYPVDGIALQMLT